MKNIRFITECFFCENEIAKKGQDPVQLLAVGAKPMKEHDGRMANPTQSFFCHCECLALRVGDPYSLNPDLGGKELDFSKTKILKRSEIPWLKKK